MDIAYIKEHLKNFPINQVNNYVLYLQRLYSETKNGQLKNPWMRQRTDDYLVMIYSNVASDGLVFDGEDITLQITGVSYSYQAYKNKMLLAYPETIIDVQLVNSGDTFTFSKRSGKVEYSHDISDPFNQSEKTVIGAYCIIKNQRGEFLTMLSRSDIDKHRNVAKTDYIWKQWYLEMALKTIIKKACKQHFKDVFKNIEKLDNENYDLDKLQNEHHPVINEQQLSQITDMINSIDGFSLDSFLVWAKLESLESMPVRDFGKNMTALKAKAKAVKK